jgi:hypothetical protein
MPTFRSCKKLKPNPSSLNKSGYFGIRRRILLPNDPACSWNEDSNDLLGGMRRHTMLEALLVSPQDGTRETSRCFNAVSTMLNRIVPRENQCTQALLRAHPTAVAGSSRVLDQPNSSVVAVLCVADSF